jgi:hypothetical protein
MRRKEIESGCRRRGSAKEFASGRFLHAGWTAAREGLFEAKWKPRNDPPFNRSNFYGKHP